LYISSHALGTCSKASGTPTLNYLAANVQPVFDIYKFVFFLGKKSFSMEKERLKK
jgi:hypothetical protein